MNNNYTIPLSERDFVFFDTEMTGLNFEHELIEIGFVKAKRQTFEFISEGDIKIFSKDITKADPNALEVIHYDPDEWAREAVPLKEGIEKFLAHTEDAILVGQNLPIDWLRLEQSLYACNLKANYYYKGLDTFSLGWLLFGDIPGFDRMSLREMAEFFNIDRGQAHRALDDARTTYQVFKALVKYHEDHKK
ncbi:MAG: 3'-5' exonuclease [Anaplasmataceae bacterium]|nr:3'-5' exonuclease [Anaplasmataceae bacterium]